MNRAFNHLLDENTSKIVQAIQNRRKVTVTKFTGEYSMNTDGKPVFVKAVEIKIYNDPDKIVYKSSGMAPTTLPRRI